MNDNLEKELRRTIQDKKFLKSLSEQIEAAQKQLQELQLKTAQLADTFRQEERALNKLENPSLLNLTSSVLGTKNAQLEKQRSKYLTAKQEYDSHQRLVKEIHTEIAIFQEQTARLNQVEERHLDLLEKKEKLLKQKQGKSARELLAIASKEEGLAIQGKKLREARETVKKTLLAIDDLVQSLDSAVGRGGMDIIGKGLPSTAIAHSCLNKANNKARIVKNNLDRLQKDLTYLEDYTNLNIELGNFIIFADFIWDGLLVDWFVQTKTHDAQDKIRNIKEQIRKIDNSLKLQSQQIVEQKDKLIQEKHLLIERSSLH